MTHDSVGITINKSFFASPAYIHFSAWAVGFSMSGALNLRKRSPIVGQKTNKGAFPTDGQLRIGTNYIQFSQLTLFIGTCLSIVEISKNKATTFSLGVSSPQSLCSSQI